MANEFKVKNGLIVSGSSWFQDDMFAVNLPTETSPNYYITWRQSDGRFEVSPAGASGAVNAIGCWDYSGYIVTPASSEFTLRGNGTSILDSNVVVLQFNKFDNNGVDQSSFFSNIGVGSVLTLTTGGVTIKYTVTGFNVVGNVYWFHVTLLSGGPSASMSVGTEVCLTLTAVTSGGGSGTGTTSGTSGGGGGTISSCNCITFNMDDNFSDVNGNSKTAIFNISPGWAQPFGQIGTSTVGMYASQDQVAGCYMSTVYFGIVAGATVGSPKLFELSYLNLKTSFLIQIALGTSPGGGNLGTTGSTIYLDMQYVSGDTGYTIPTGASFTLCKI